MPKADNLLPVKIYIASGKEAAADAQILAGALLEYKSNLISVTPETWWDQIEGSYTLDMLTEKTEICDFAAIILSGRDITEKGDTGPRDNCIFEAGLFTAALGDPRRCFLVVSSDQRLLPNDLAGLRPIPFTDGDVNSIKRAANRIGQAIHDFARKQELKPPRGPKKLRTVTVDELIQKEKPEELGGVLQALSANVFVQKARGEEFSRRVMDNMCNYNIDYRYIFEASDFNISAIARLIMMLLKVEVSKSISEGIEEMKSSLAIHFVPDRKGLGLQYCIHNANDPYTAICYMRVPGVDSVEWIEWGRRSEAIGVADEISRMCIMDQSEKENGIFRSTIYFKLYENTRDKKVFLSKLWNELIRQSRQGIQEFRSDDIKALGKASFGDFYADDILAGEAASSQDI